MKEKIRKALFLGFRSSLGGFFVGLGARSFEAIYGMLTSSLLAITDSFSTPRSVMSIRLFNGFRLMPLADPCHILAMRCEKADEPEELKMLCQIHIK